MSLTPRIKRTVKAAQKRAQALELDARRELARRTGRPIRDAQGRIVVIGTDGKEHPMGAQPRPEVPECPPGWHTGPPDFVIVGAEKGGTSRWLKILRAHPDIHVGKGIREIHFWDDFADRWPTQEDIERYHTFFPRPEGGKAGEKTPQYMSLWWAPRMLSMAAPDCRIVMMLRDPIDRYISGRTQLEKYRPPDRDTKGFLDFGRRSVELSMHRGEYTRQLEWVLDAFPREQVLVLQFEACNADTQGQLDRTFDHIGVARWTPPEALTGKEVNAAWLEKVPLEPERRELLQRLYRPEVMRLKGIVPELDLSLWPNFADLAD